MLDIDGVIGAPFGDLRHLEDAAARRIHLEAQFAISRTRVQAESAMDATVEIGLPRADLDFRRDFLFRYGHRAGPGSTDSRDRTYVSRAA